MSLALPSLVHPGLEIGDANTLIPIPPPAMQDDSKAGMDEDHTYEVSKG
jgi:hypothetical protein